MKRISKFILLLLVLSIVFEKTFCQTGPGAILPAEKEVPGWRTTGEYKLFKGEELKNLIGREAELVMEYGFRSAVSCDYYNFIGKVITLRIYTMNNTFGSYGYFLQKGMGEKQFKEFGNGTFEKKGSYCFWKQMYFVELISAFSGDTVAQGFRQIAGVIDSKVKSRGNLPEIMKLSENKRGTPLLFKGPVALGNIYYFGPVNIFDINEGLAIIDTDSKELIFKYADNNEAVRRFSDAAGIMGKMQRYSEFKLVDRYSYTLKDKDGKTLTIKVDNDCLDVVIK
jgi:hypothetical protein